MENPWKALPEHELVLPEDRSHVDAFNRDVDSKYRLNTAVLPQPFLGPRDARLVILALNPGKRGWTDGPYARALRDDLTSDHGTPFPPLREEFVSGDGSWWKTCLGAIATSAERPISSLADDVLSIEFLPYHSISYRTVPVTLPSQRYSFGLVRAAIERGATIVVLRGRRSWTVAVPELLKADVVFSGNPRVGAISPGTLGEDSFNRIVEVFGASSKLRPPGQSA